MRALGADTLKSKQGELWTEGGKYGIDMEKSKGLAQELRMIFHSLDRLRGELGDSYRGDGKYDIDFAMD